MTIPDAAIGAAAEAILVATMAGVPADPETVARAAIEAAMPAIREAIAQEIEAADRKPWCTGAAEAARIVRGGTH